MSIPRLKVGHYIDRSVALLGSSESLEKLPLCDFQLFLTPSFGLKLEERSYLVLLSMCNSRAPKG
jgi:hypothetical protein